MKIYFAGSIRGGRDDALLYFDIIAAMQTMGHKVLTEHAGLKDLTLLGEQDKTVEFIYSRDMDWLRESDCVVAEVTSPSLGVGYEIAQAENLKKPILCLYRPSAGRSLSAMIAGSPEVTVIEYSALNDACKAVNKFLDELGPA